MSSFFPTLFFQNFFSLSQKISNRQTSEQIYRVHRVITKQHPGQIQNTAKTPVAPLCPPNATPSIHKRNYFLNFMFYGKHIRGCIYNLTSSTCILILVGKFWSLLKLISTSLCIYTYSNIQCTFFHAGLLWLNIYLWDSTMWLHVSFFDG